MLQLELPADPKEWPGRNYVEAIQYNHAMHAFLQVHRGTGWIWDGRLITKTAEISQDDEDDETCHYQLFGETTYQVRFRGWFNNGILTLSDRRNEVRHADEIPQQLFEHLSRKFPIKTATIRIF